MADMFELREASHKGYGLFATQGITKGTCILSDEPVITFSSSMCPEDVILEIPRLSEEQKLAVLALHSSWPHANIEERYIGIARTNTFSVGMNSSGIVLRASRINHSCDNNSMHCWDEATGDVQIHAIKDISEGEEITTNYIGRGFTRSERQEKLQTTFNFKCACELCSLSDEASAAIDHKALRLRELWTLLKDVPHKPHERHIDNPLLRLRRLEEVVRLEIDVGSSTRLYDAYLEASALDSDVARGKIFMERAHDAYVLEHGTRNTIADDCKRIAMDVTTCACFGQSTRWMTSEDDAPQQTVSGSFEDWLWRKQTNTLRDNNYTDLHDRNTFLGIFGLPKKGSYDIEYHEQSSDGPGKPRRHWCFVGQIITVADPGGELQLMVQDVDGNVAGIFFHNEEEARRLAATQEKGQSSQLEVKSGEEHDGSKTIVTTKFGRGDTILVLYAEREDYQQNFIMRVTDTSTVKVRSLKVRWKHAKIDFS